MGRFNEVTKGGYILEKVQQYLGDGQNGDRWQQIILLISFLFFCWGGGGGGGGCCGRYYIAQHFFCH